MIFPVVCKESIIALNKFCIHKDPDDTKLFLKEVWNKEALNAMMKITQTNNLDELVKWLINPNNK